MSNSSFIVEVEPGLLNSLPLINLNPKDKKLPCVGYCFKSKVFLSNLTPDERFLNLVKSVVSIDKNCLVW